MIFKFCPLCGSEMRSFEEEGFSRERCERCGWVHYHNSRPTAAVIIARGGKILLTKRAKDPEKGKWDTAGGFLEEKEMPEQGLVREVKEELGVEIEVGRLIGIFGPTYYPFRGHDYYNFDLFYEAEVVSGEPSAHDDVAEIGWFSPDDLPEIAFPSVIEAIQVFRKLNLD